MYQVLQGLVYLHNERHVIHRDIKPSNLLVNHKGEVKITDFGVSASLASSMGQRDTFVGTYNYMSVCDDPFPFLFLSLLPFFSSLVHTTDKIQIMSSETMTLISLSAREN
jgi:hypothetical protein